MDKYELAKKITNRVVRICQENNYEIGSYYLILIQLIISEVKQKINSGELKTLEEVEVFLNQWKPNLSEREGD